MRKVQRDGRSLDWLQRMYEGLEYVLEVLRRLISFIMCIRNSYIRALDRVIAQSSTRPNNASALNSTMKSKSLAPVLKRSPWGNRRRITKKKATICRILCMRDGRCANHINIFRASRGWLSFGQYGHLNRPPLHKRFSDSSAITCPHGIIIGGFSSVACSLETGQTKMEWNRYDGGRGIST